MRVESENLMQTILTAINTRSGVRLGFLCGLVDAGFERKDKGRILAVDAGSHPLPRVLSNRLTGLAELRTT